VLSAMPTFTLPILRVPKKILREVDKCRRRFLWHQDDEITGASCKVNWPTVCAPTEQGGLGILDLQRFGRALHLRWLSTSGT
uniref:Reverse transcriptase zinc-binding domain-containing protein n=1 Tax=Aegilops tauschii subsp. strangulata TaxID=200361 RepID=A0A453DE37_AEGTS